MGQLSFEELSEPTIAESLMSEYDKNAKELRLNCTSIRREPNHTTKKKVVFETKNIKRLVAIVLLYT